MDLTVGVGPPRSALPADLDVGLPLVKAALLYGDRVVLCSPAASLLVRLRDHAPTDVRGRLAVLAGIADDLGLGDAPARLAHALDAGHRLNADAVAARVERWWGQYRRALGDAVARSGLRQMAPAVAAGRLRIETLGVQAIARPSDFAEAAAETYATAVAQAVASGATVPLLDGATAETVGGAVRDGRLAVPQVREAEARSGAFASRVLHRLPVFERATVAEILDVREDLSGPLARFRADVDALADEIAAAAWDNGFADETARLYRARVAPALAEIEDAVASVGYLRELVTRYAERPGQFVPLAAPALTVALTSADVLAQTVSAVLAGGSVAANAAQAAWAWRDARREVRAQRLFFVHAVGRRLAGRSEWG